jgi:carbonic anhydrase
MKKIKFPAVILVAALLFTACAGDTKNRDNATEKPGENTAVSHPSINTPEDALAELTNGNRRFMEGKLINTNYQEEIEATKTDQHPHSLILSCLDSRIPPEIIFDQGIGRLFVARVAGNVEDPNILGSMEFAAKIKGTKLIVVMGHNRCGAVKGAIDNAELGNLTQLVSQIKPAITGETSDPDGMLTETAKKNVQLTITDILNQSVVLNELVKEGQLKIVGAIYDITTGKVSFLD